VLAGITVTNGHGLLFEHYSRGGGMYCDASSPTVTDCVFDRNYAHAGGGAYCSGGSPSFVDCIFSNNSGCGVCAAAESEPELIGCAFYGNSISSYGGGLICARYSSVVATDCIFIGNVAAGGGGVFAVDTNSQITGCVFHGNSATYEGGGASCYFYEQAVFAHCTFSGNSSEIGGAVFCYDSDPVFEDCTFYGNFSDEGAFQKRHGDPTVSNTIIAFSPQGCAIECEGGSPPTLTCCDIYGNAGGDWVGGIASQYGIAGNISEDPLFCDPENGNFFLHEDSPCAPFSPPNPECDLIGAWPVGCDPALVSEPARSRDRLQLSLCVPTPCVGDAQIEYTIPDGICGMHFRLDVLDPTGRRVRTIAHGAARSGSHCACWSGLSKGGGVVPSGSYYCRLRVGVEERTKRLILVR
jgi:hypothetical protein